MQHQFARAFELTAPADEGMRGEMCGRLPEPGRERVRRLRVVPCDVFENGLQVGQRAARPLKLHDA
ncbi:MAG: hypothetical protein ABS92_12085 [Thiobacillus sp. SCN 63-374]|nr:MAG: hypothetical protein ABS92_12085 [Thiobacillus sp. SCN 63-374]